MGFLVDTSIWVDVERGRLAPADVAEFTKDEAVFLSPVTLSELRYGLELSKNSEIKQRREAAYNRLKKKPVLPINAETGEMFGSIAAKLNASGRGHEFRVQDIWIASQAIQHNYKLLSHNEKDFSDVPGLSLVVVPHRV